MTWSPHFPAISSPCSRIARPESVVSGSTDPSTFSSYGSTKTSRPAPSAVVIDTIVGLSSSRGSASDTAVEPGYSCSTTASWVR